MTRVNSIGSSKPANLPEKPITNKTNAKNGILHIYSDNIYIQLDGAQMK